MIFENFVTTSIEFSSRQSLADQGFAERRDRIENIISTIYTADKEAAIHQGLKREGIISFAKELEQIMEKEGQHEHVNQICSIVCNRFKSDGKAWIAEDAVEILDDKYKRDAYQWQRPEKNEQSSRRSTPPPGVDQPVECSITGNQVIRWLSNFYHKFNLDSVDAKTHQKILDLSYDVVHKEEEYCNQHHIAHHNTHEPKTSFDECNDAADDKFSEKISKPKALIARSVAIQKVDQEAYKKTLKLCEYLTKWANKQINDYPSQRLDQAIRWRDAVEAFIRIIQQYLDNKARRTILQWAKINSNMAEHGGTAAASMSAQPVFVPNTNCEQLIDPDTLEPAYRTITKEQIDARGPGYASTIDFIIRALPFLEMCEERYIQIEVGFGEWRAWTASEKLSRNA